MINMSALKVPKLTNNIISERSIKSNNNYNEVMNEIQQNYLIQNSNGTFKINPIAYSIFPKTVMNKIVQGMNFTNQEILNGNLDLKLVKNSSGIKVVKTIKANIEAIAKNLDANINIANSNTPKGAIDLFMSNSQFYSNYCYNFHFNWSGFYCAVNTTGCYLLANQMEDVAEIYGGSAGVAGISGNIEIAGGLAAVGIYYQTITNALNTGAEDGSGATIDVWGGTETSSVIYWASANY